MTGAVVPWSRPTTCTSWLPDDVSVKATTVAGSGLIALAVAMPRRPMPGAVEVPTAWTVTGLPQASAWVVAPASGAAAEAVVALTTPVPAGSHR